MCSGGGSKSHHWAVDRGSTQGRGSSGAGAMHSCLLTSAPHWCDASARPPTPFTAHPHSFPASSQRHSCQQVPWPSGRGTPRRDPARQVAFSDTEQSPPDQLASHSHTPSEVQLRCRGGGRGRGGLGQGMQAAARRSWAGACMPCCGPPTPWCLDSMSRRFWKVCCCAVSYGTAPPPAGPSCTAWPTCRARCSCAGSARACAPSARSPAAWWAAGCTQPAATRRCALRQQGWEARRAGAQAQDQSRRCSAPQHPPFPRTRNECLSRATCCCCQSAWLQGCNRALLSQAARLCCAAVQPSNLGWGRGSGCTHCRGCPGRACGQRRWARGRLCRLPAGGCMKERGKGGGPPSKVGPVAQPLWLGRWAHRHQGCIPGQVP